MKRISTGLAWAAVALLVMATVLPVAAKGKETGYQTGFTLWRGADGGFAGWTLTGASVVTGVGLRMDPITAVSEQDPYSAGEYYGKNFYNGSEYLVGEAVSPVVTPSFTFTEAIASWNADTPAGTWIETLVSAKMGERWTKWYNLGIWASDLSTIERHSVSLQGDADGYVAVDTLVLAKSKTPATALRVKVRLFSADGLAVPTVRNISLASSSELGKMADPQQGNSTLWTGGLAIPKCSQMVYSDGGNVWCSPTSTSMVLGYWDGYSGPCESIVRAAVAGVFDWKYDGHGNWPFNTAYAASAGREGYVARFTSLAELEPWLSAGVPVVLSVAWGKGEMTNAPIASTSGHLLVLAGFDADGNALVNDPAAASNDDVRRTYLRGELESAWLENSGGTVYLIFPSGLSTPPLNR